MQGRGTWTEQDDTVNAWLDARVANVRFHKRVLIDVAAPYGDTWMRTLHVAEYRETMADGWERWGADTIEIYPTGGPDGTALTGDVVARVRFQHDLDGDGADEMLTTAWVSIHGNGDATWPGDEVWSLDLSSPIQAGDATAEPLLLYSPYDDPGLDVEARIEAITAAQLADPSARHTVHAAVFNITDDGIVDRLIQAHAAGVEVRLLFDGRKFRPGYAWYTGDDRLLGAGVPLLGVVRDDGAMHDKIALFDGAAVATGSFNWEWGARFENHELMVVTQHPDLLAADLDAEFVDLLRRYDPSFDPDAWPQATLAFDAYCDLTHWGEQLRVVGDHEALGEWDPLQGLPLDAPGWPWWTGELSVPRGTRADLKLVITDAHGGADWEAGEDIHVRAFGAADVVEVPLSFR